jgi:hypothetical protein
MAILAIMIDQRLSTASGERDLSPNLRDQNIRWEALDNSIDLTRP